MLCVVGDLVEDVVARSLAATVPDTDNPAVVDRVRGGSGANVAAAAAALGGAVRFVGCVGADDVGDRLVAELAAGGVDVRVQRGSRTGAIVVVVEPGGGRTMYPDRGAAAELGPIDPSWAEGVTWLHLPAYSLASDPAAGAASAFSDVARHAGSRLSVDVSSVGLVNAYGPEPFTALLERLAPDVVLATAEELAALTRRPAVSTVVVKDGARPVVVHHPDGTAERVAVPPIEGVVDTTGAGDAFAAGYLLAAMDGAAPAAAARAGVAAAARTLASPEPASNDSPHRNDVTDRGVGRRMELADALAFAADHRHGVLTTLKADGRPQLSNITYAFVDGVFVISVTDSRAKTKNLRRDPRTSLYVTRSDFFAYAVLEGETELSPVAAAPDDDTVEQLVEHYKLIAGEHPDWDDFRRSMVADGRLAARFTPTRAYGMLSLPES